jgi:transcriptional regulator with XRE-family HTH domain
MTTSEIIRNSVIQAISICGSQVALAKKANITQGAVGKYLRGEAKPTGVTARKLSLAVESKLSPADFAPDIFGEPENNQDTAA